MRSADLTAGRGPCDVTVTICTYNRQRLLEGALESILANQVPVGVSYEVIVVDNNSTDGTRAVVESFIRRSCGNVRYLFERKQGLSYARNTAIAAARSAIVAFTDDDVRVAADWVPTIKRLFDQHPEVDCVGGKVLPSWDPLPPAWLTQAHWSPLGIVDYGDRPFYVNANVRLCLLGANLAIRKHALEQIGRFQPETQRVQQSVGSMEDHEMLTRLWKNNRQGLYAPELVVTSGVAADRLSKRYHRRWHLGHGRFYAMARLPEMEESRSGRLFDVSAHIYRRAVLDALSWAGNVICGRRSRAFAYETSLWFFSGYFRQRYEDFRAAGGRTRLGEIGRFARSFMRARLRQSA
ncbi:MAG TPA: glycosyltransferase [Vicinamibacterales bacterium]|nr:glycosyltransferase [Vicinamibacterales bacterium]